MRDFNRVFTGPDFGFGPVQVTKDRVQCGGLAGPGRTTNIKQTIGLFNGFHHPLSVVRRQPQLIQWNGFACGQNPHHHILDATGRRNGGDPQFDVERPVLLELYLAVLWAPTLRNIKVTHDLEASHHGLPEVRRHLDIGHQRAIDAKAYTGLEFARHRFNMNVRGFLVVSINDDLVDKLDQLIVRGRRLQRVVAAAVIDRRTVHVGQHFIDGYAARRAKDLRQRLLKFRLRRHPIGKATDAGKHLRHDARTADHLRVSTHHHQPVSRLLQRYPALFIDKVTFEHAM